MSAPLADKIRPKTLADVVGQEHILAEGKPLRKIIDSGTVTVHSMTPNTALWRISPNQTEDTTGKSVKRNNNENITILSMR